MGCFAVGGHGNLNCIKNIMDSLKYQAILARIVMPSVQRLKLDLTFLQDSNPNYTSKSTYACLRDRRRLFLSGLFSLRIYISLNIFGVI